MSNVELLINHGISDVCREKGSVALHLAAFTGEADVINFLVSKGLDINAKVCRNMLQGNLNYEDILGDLKILIDNDKDFEFYLEYLSSKTALHISSFKKHENTVRSLLKNGADIYSKDHTGNTALQVIIQKGMAKILVEECIPLNTTYCDKYSPLQLGAAEGELSFVKYCIEEGCDINARSRLEDVTALDLAIISGHVPIVNYLIECGVVINSRRRDGTTALDWAVLENKKDILSILIKNNAKINAVKEREYALSAIVVGYQDIVEYFLTRNPANGFSRPECSEFPLVDAVGLGHLNIVKMLLQLDKREDINYPGVKGYTPLQWASLKGNTEISKILLSNGADPNISETSPPLNLAIENEDSEMIEILIKAGANISLVDKNGKSAIDLAINCTNPDIMEIFLEFSKIDINLKGRKDRTLLHNAAASGSLQIVKSLVGKGGLINCRDSSGAKPIHLAAKKGHQNIVEYFLNEGLIDILDRGGNDWSLLHYAAAGNQFHICEFLIKNGINVNTVDKDGCTPLHVAAKENKFLVLHNLLHYGACYDFRNKSNETPFDAARSTSSWTNISILISLNFISNLFSAVLKNQVRKVDALLKEGLRFSEFGYANVKNAKNVYLLHYAAWKGFEEMAVLLLKYNADPNVRTENGSTPLHYAAKFSHSRIVSALLSNGAMFDAECNLNKTASDYSTDQNIFKILHFLKEMFENIQNGENFVDSLIHFDFIDAEKVLMRAKNLSGRTLFHYSVIKDHPEVDKFKNHFYRDLFIKRNAAYELSKEGHLEVSLQKFKTILAEGIDLFGNKDLVILNIQEHTTLVLFQLKMYDEALELADRIYRIRKEILAEYNEGNLLFKELMSLLQILKGRKKEALIVYEEILNENRDRLGLENVATLTTQITFAKLLYDEESEKETLKAMKLCSETLDKLKLFSERDLTVLRIKLKAAKLIRDLGNPSESLEIFKNVFEIEKEMFGLDNPDTLDSLFEIGITLLQMGEKEDALKSLEDTLRIQLGMLEPNHKKIMKTKYWIANVLHLQRMYLEALKIYETDLESRISILGENDPEILDTQDKIEFIHSYVLQRKHNHGDLIYMD